MKPVHHQGIRETMENIIILGSGGRAGDDILKKLNVAKQNVFTFTEELQLANKINSQVSQVGVVNWIGHGYPRWLNIPAGGLKPNEAATLFQLLNLNTASDPKSKIVLWACNTGLQIAETKLSAMLWKAYRNSKEYRRTPEFKAITQTKDYIQTQYKIDKLKTFESLRVEMKNSEVGQITQSVAYRIAKHMTLLHGIHVYAPTMGVQPGAIASFDMPQGPGNMVEWAAHNDDGPITVSPRKAGFIAVSEQVSTETKINEKTGEETETGRRAMRLICTYDKGAKNSVFKYHSLYVDL
jgi:hypothetical protein